MEALNLYPILTLREHVSAFESAEAQCHLTPDPKTVHRLRTSSRRLEAVMTLLETVSGLPPHRKRTATLGRALARVRRAAGAVRDLDVHSSMLAEFAEAEQGEAPAAGEPATFAQPKNGRPGRAAQDGESDPEQETSEALGAGAEVLRTSALELQAHLSEKREHEVLALGRTLKDGQKEIAHATAALLKRILPAAEVQISAADLVQHAQTLATRDGLLNARVEDLGKRQLHALRKAAKAGRYLAETLPGDPLAAALAKQLESLQGIGGQWHDALEITAAARRHFGRKHPLTAVYRDRRDMGEAAYRKALGAEQTALGTVSVSRKPTGVAKDEMPRTVGTAAA